MLFGASLPAHGRLCHPDSLATDPVELQELYPRTDSWGPDVKTNSTVILALSFSACLHMAANAETRSAAYEGGYIMAAFGTCPVTAIYGRMERFIKYIGTRDYNRGYAAFEAEFKKSSRPSKLCFDAARESDFFSVR